MEFKINFKRIFTNNKGLKAIALFLAILVWAIITGRERSFIEKSIEINVEYFNVSKKIDVRNIRPDKIRLKIRGTSKKIAQLTNEDFKVKLDLKGIKRGPTVIFYTEDYLEYPEDIKIVSIFPKMIELTIDEFYSKEVEVRIKYIGKLPKGIILKDRKVIPEKITIFGYKSEIKSIRLVEGEKPINLSQIKETKKIKIKLKRPKDILKFENQDYVEVIVEVENKNVRKKK